MMSSYLATRRRRRAEHGARTSEEARRLLLCAREAARVLASEFGAASVVLFGSLVDGTFHDGSDVDIAVFGLRPEDMFFANARAAAIVGRNVDLVDMRVARPTLAAHIQATGVVLWPE